MHSITRHTCLYRSLKRKHFNTKLSDRYRDLKQKLHLEKKKCAFYMPTNHSLLEFNLQLKYFSIMLVGIVGTTTTIKVGEWGKKYWEKSKCYETNIRDIEPFFKNGDHFYTSVNFLDSEKKVFFLLLLCVCLLL